MSEEKPKNYEFIQNFYLGMPLKDKTQETKTVKEYAVYVFSGVVMAVRNRDGSLWISDGGFLDRMFYPRLKAIAYYVGCRVYRKKGVGSWENEFGTKMEVDSKLKLTPTKVKLSFDLL